MDALKHHDSDASNQQDDDETLLPADHPVMQQFLAHFDPLARLEAEYAAVLAQSPSSSSAATSKSGPEDDDSGGNNQKHGDGENDENEDEDEDDTYARVPMSPVSDDEDGGGGEYYQPLGDASDSDDDGAVDSDNDAGDDETEDAHANANELDTSAAVVKMDAAKRETIMKSMQGLQLAPPPWAKSAKLSDDELFAMVRDLNSR